MRKIIFLAIFVLAACADTGVMQIGPNRYRITKESAWSVGTAETAAIQQAQAHCASQGRTADIQTVRAGECVAGCG